MKIRSFITTILVVGGLFTQAQQQPLRNLFQKKVSVPRDFHEIASSYELLQTDSAQLSGAAALAKQDLSLSLPFENSALVLKLKPATITSPHFSVIEGISKGSSRELPYQLPSFYQGSIEGSDKSFAAISFAKNQVIGILSDRKSNIILGSIEQNGRATNQYALYRDIDLKVSAASNCFTDDNALSAVTSTIQTRASNAREQATGQPVEIYFECDYKFYQDKGSNVNTVVNYVLSFFNSVALLYANENIQVQVSQIKVWTTPDPYASFTTTSAVLSSFAANMSSDPSWVGDYAHFLSTRSLGGGIAYLLSNPCVSARANRTGVSAIDNTYKNFPVYSWTVNVVTHELGHNFGSHHTHWCGWTSGPIDWCGPTANASYTEGTCTPGSLPAAGGGTIMSYCHLLGGVGINLSNGFGPLPGAAIRTAIGAASCFGTCKMTLTNLKVDASCGQNNGSATITPANGTGTYTYLWSNAQTGATLTNAAPGNYSVTVTDGAGCKLTTNDTIVNAGASLPVVLTPAGSGSFCTGNSIQLAATNNSSYNYQWYNNAVLINGATSATYTAAAAGNYSVNVISGACNVTKSVTITQVTQPAASISAAGNVNLCTGNRVLLNASPSGSFQYQWYKNGVAISAATANSYSSSAAGSYTVKVYAGTCESTSAAIAVTVAAAPTASITSNGSLNFCNGGSASLSANTGTGYTYQWNRNGVGISGATQPGYAAAIAGSYTVTSFLGTCSKTSSAVNVSVLSNPTISIHPDSSVILKYQTQTLTASGGESYNWAAQPGLVSSTLISGVLQPLVTTVYTIEGTGSNGCKASGTAKIIVAGCGEVTRIESIVGSPSRTLVKWVNPQGTTGDTIQYRLAGTAVWNSVFSDSTQVEINGLMPGSQYEYRIIPLCAGVKSYIPSIISDFQTPALSSGIYLKLYPNPVVQSGKLEIIVSKDYTLQADLYNMQGQKIMNISPTENLKAGQTLKSINGVKLSSGLYQLVIRIDGKIYTVKMVVRR